MKLTILTLTICMISSVCGDYAFPDWFKFGAATSAYQVEGAWNEEGKGESIWDRAVHEHPEKFSNGATGDIACDSYHNYKRDIEMLKELGVNYYRFSISWPRILPSGKIDKINEHAIDYYNNLINELLANGIEPYVTIFHWDLPQALQDEGGWTNRNIIDHYINYARLVFERFGDRVKTWMTFNEIRQICLLGYAEGEFAPFLINRGIGDYECTHIVLLAHGRTYRMYENDFKEQQKGRVGMAIDSYWHEPNLQNDQDKEAAERNLQMDYGWYVHPVVKGNYPQVLIDRVKYRSDQEGREKSRLPEFTQEEIEMLKGTYDFLGLNNYSGDLVWFADDDVGYSPSHWRDVGVQGRQDPAWNNVVAWGLRELLIWIREEYGNPPVIITENGYGDGGGLQDYDRMNYIKQYLNEILNAIYEHDCNVIAYTVWSLMDNFEWTGGYSVRFGLHDVDFNDGARTRTPKLSAMMYKDIIFTRHIDWNSFPAFIDTLHQ